MTLYDVGERIRNRRKMLGMNQDELAELASLNRVTIAKYESGKVEPGAQALSRIADALETSVDVLLGRNVEETAAPAADEEDLYALREQWRRDPNTRIMYEALTKVKPDNIKLATVMLKALGPQEDDE